MDIIDKVKVTKTLGAGMLGTTYLATHRGKSYALKVQHILPEDRIKDFKHELWRELDLYEYIDRLPRADQIFFTRLHAFKIYDKCTHEQKRPFAINDADWKKRAQALDESEWCVKYLLDYKGTTTLVDYLGHDTPTPAQSYSLMLQICNMVYILARGGYSHGDLHSGNIMINETKKKYFTFRGARVPYHGLQLTAIDYGEVLHKKFGIRYDRWQKKFLDDPEAFMNEEMRQWSWGVINNWAKFMHDCRAAGKPMPWELKAENDTLRDILTKHSEFCRTVIPKYYEMFPAAEALVQFVLARVKKSKKPIFELVKDKRHEQDFWAVMNRVDSEFQMAFPELHAKYRRWCSVHGFSVPRTVVQELLLTKDGWGMVDCLLRHV